MEKIFGKGRLAAMDNGKLDRVLLLYEQLRAGKAVNKAEAAGEYGVTERSIQRDIDALRAFFSEQAAHRGVSAEIVYDRARKGFVLEGAQDPVMTNSEILAVSKILLESRAFRKEDMASLLDKLIAGCVPRENMKLVSELIANERHHYVELAHPLDIQDMLWDVASAIQSRELLRLSYQRRETDQPPVERVVEPVSILFSEYYFYLNAYIVQSDELSLYTHKYDYPAVFRMDRIRSCVPMKIRFRIPYSSRFQEGEFRKRVQFMYAGKLSVVRFRYTGPSLEAILDRLPTAEVISRDGRGAVIEAEIYGKGILMWVMSQGRYVELLSPKPLREELRQTLAEMLALYEENPAENDK